MGATSTIGITPTVSVTGSAVAAGAGGGQVFVRDLVANTTTLVSTGISGQGNGGFAGEMDYRSLALAVLQGYASAATGARLPAGLRPAISNL